MKPKVTRDTAVTLWKQLAGKGFRKAKEIDMPNRLIRAVCTEYPSHFLSTQQGYKLTSEASVNEIEVAIADLKSRCRHMQNRANALEGVLLEKKQKGLF